MPAQPQSPISSAVAGKIVFLLIGCLGLGDPRPLQAQHLSPLASKPDWSMLDRYQETISRDDFLRLLDTVHAPGNAGMVHRT